MLNKQKKGEILKDLETDLKTAKIVIFVNFHGLNVSASHKLRKLLREIGVKYLVVKKTLIKKVLEVVKFAGEMPQLEGETAVAFSESDSLEPFKVIQKFSKENKVMKMTAGIFESKYIDSEKVMTLANIPSREILLVQLINVINSPMRGLVVTLNGIAKK